MNKKMIYEIGSCQVRKGDKCLQRDLQIKPINYTLGNVKKIAFAIAITIAIAFINEWTKSL